MIANLLRDLIRGYSVALGIISASLGACISARLLDSEPSVVFWLGSPALVISAWIALGHLMTIDDDYPGGFSNPENDQSLWRSSLRELVAKFLIFGCVSLAVGIMSGGRAIVAG